jgi:hypothetical protein
MLGSPVDLGEAANTGFQCDVVWTGSQYVVSWPDTVYHLQLARVDIDGTPYGPTVRLATSVMEEVDPVLAWTGSEIGVSLRGWDMVDNWTIRGMILSPDGTPRVTDFPVRAGTLPSRGDMLWTGSEFVYSWVDPPSDMIYINRVSPDGVVSPTPVFIGYGHLPEADPALAWSGSEIGIAFIDDYMSNTELYFTRAGFCE